MVQPVVVLHDMVQSVVGGGEGGVGSGNPDFLTDTNTGTGQITKIPYLNPYIYGSTRRAQVATSLRPPPWKNPVHAPAYADNDLCC